MVLIIHYFPTNVFVLSISGYDGKRKLAIEIDAFAKSVADLGGTRVIVGGVMSPRSCNKKSRKRDATVIQISCLFPLNL